MGFGVKGFPYYIICYNYNSYNILYMLYIFPQLVKNPPAMQEIPVQSLGWEDPLNKGIGYQLQYSRASLMALLLLSCFSRVQLCVTP